jgi:DNA-binding NtrC family response regulator
MGISPRALVASPDLHSRRALVAILNEEGWSTISASRLRDCQEVLTRHHIEVVFCEPYLADGDYHELLGVARLCRPPVPVIVTSRTADWNEYRAALHDGALDLIPSPFHSTDVRRSISLAKCERGLLSMNQSKLTSVFSSVGCVP